MLAGSAGLYKGRETHQLDAMRIIHDLCNEIEVSAARCWAKSAILTPTMNADMLAGHASRTKCTTSQETKDLVNSIFDTFSKLLLLTNSHSLDSLPNNIRDLSSLQKQCSKDELSLKPEEWSIIEESADFVAFPNK